MTNEEMIEILGGIRACYDIFNEWDRSKYRALSMAIEALKSQKHGQWIKRSKLYPDLLYDSTYNYECSNCGYMDTHGEDVEVPYCWHCGAKMDERGEDETI